MTSQEFCEALDFVQELSELVDNNPTVNNIVIEDEINEVATIIEEVDSPTNTSEESSLNTEPIVNPYTQRFSSASWFEAVKRPIVLAGCGGIGSWVAPQLARLGATLSLYDPDSFDPSNMAGQMVSYRDIGHPKVTVAIQNIKNYSNPNSTHYTFCEKWQEGCIMERIAICGFDNMEARKAFFKGWLNMVVNEVPADERHTCLFIDGRLAAETFQILTIRGDDEANIAKYEEKYLFSDDEADEVVCSFKQTSFMAIQIAGRMVEQYVNHCDNIANPDSEFKRLVPFFIERDAKFSSTDIEL